MSEEHTIPFGTRLEDWLPRIRGEFQEVFELWVTLQHAAGSDVSYCQPQL